MKKTGLLGMLFGRRARARRERAADAVRRARLSLDAGDSAAALEICRGAMLESPDDRELLVVASESALRENDRSTSELLARAADGGGDPQRFFELGSHLLATEAADLAAAVLARALELAPFDAVVRSELALAQLRSGRPQQAIETLALHPCLADDPGALFELAWASLLCGDVDAAAAAREPLEAAGAPRTLVAKLDCALERATIPPSSDPPDARDYLFLEHGALLLDPAPSARGRFVELDVDALRASRLVTLAAEAIGELAGTPPRVTAADDGALALAHALADRLGASVEPLGEGRVPPGVLVARAANDLEPLAARLGDPTISGTITFALVLDWSRTAARVPDVIGATARKVTWRAFAEGGLTSEAIDSGELLAYVRARRAHLAPHGRRVAAAWVPDAPLPQPTA